jgi:hypothetical protein
MKTTLIIIFSLLALGIKAQHVMIVTGAEKTVAGMEYAATLLVETSRLWGVGSFYQTGLSRENAEGTLQQKNIFYGMVFQVPVVKADRMAFLFNLRSGFVNQHFLVVVPSVETRMQMSKKIGIAIGTGFRMGYPSISGKLMYTLF